MNKIFIIPDDFVFSPCKVDGSFWSNFHILLSYLGNPESIVDLKNTNPEQYEALIEPLVRFITCTEEELNQKGYIKEQELPEN